MNKIIVDLDDSCLEQVFAVRFIDDNGMSILVRTKKEDVAQRKKLKFERYLEEGRLLRPELSVLKYR